jgi:hypothetical protein
MEEQLTAREQLTKFAAFDVIAMNDRCASTLPVKLPACEATFANS